MTEFPPLPVVELTERERELVEAARHGRSLAGDAPVRALVLRELLLGLRGPLDPRGVRLEGAGIAGPLDLDHVEAVVGLALVDCVIEEPVTARYARLPWLDLSGSKLGTVELSGAHIAGSADLAGAEITNDDGSALAADRLHAGELHLTGVRATAAGGAAISLLGAQIGGQVTLGGAVLVNRRGSALSADGLRTDDSFHADGLKATCSGEYGAICLISAHVGGHLYLEGAEFANDLGPALSGDRLRVEGSLRLGELEAAGAGEWGTIRLVGAQIDGQLNLQDARIANDSGSALYADGLHVGSILYLAGAHLAGAGSDGTLRLHSVEVAGQALLREVELTNASGPALSADDLRVGTYLELAGLTATCTSDIGALSLIGARIGGQFTLLDAEVANDAGPALLADRCQIRDSLVLSGLRATGAGELGTIRLLGARVAGQLSCTGAEIANRDGLTMVSLEDAVVEGPLFLPVEVVCSGSSCSGLVYLDGFRFGSLEEVTWREWLHLIRHHTSSYRPGPYQQLAASERAAGHDGNARQVLIAQQRDLQRRAPEAIGGWPARRFHWLWGALAGYGYRARRTAAALLLAVAAAGGLGLWAGHVTEGGHRAAERTTDLAAQVGTPCSAVELVGVGLDRGLPLSPGVRGRCDLNTGIGAGQAFTVAIWLVQAAIWALATLALVGYTGLVRKTG